MSSFLPPKSRLLELTKLRCNIFNENFNPLNIRTGSKILTQRLKGENIKRYYGNPDMIRFKELRSLYPTIDWVDPAEVYRLKINQSRKRRGKGAPKKKKEKGGDKKKKK
ncbi:hypothetical protein WICANDRAFT_63527 [Wickerhamomyces anomalus NRRL Y-366-8]|uniref:Small ribosomal subunit protein mS33 n=1 Tax=Wickerhamomyces anomalus (strain ATCC 58044 / CBS 1984 / NCYC 433 / NRRL Y-366-8) TaxID=683960 RepID=A0A1E3P2A3_WICAA|nr:uncharacterized protein WICANDRAFT_63527 [Wickerhamomyces anomalus NRRL Y-366-8]ODQ59027.1 hypothetical protein WICANDRAFT_63527 [Wickerhamomyces anomalus NRRL Y-366-8]